MTLDTLLHCNVMGFGSGDENMVARNPFGNLQRIAAFTAARATCHQLNHGVLLVRF